MGSNWLVTHHASIEPNLKQKASQLLDILDTGSTSKVKLYGKIMDIVLKLCPQSVLQSDASLGYALFKLESSNGYVL